MNVLVYLTFIKKQILVTTNISVHAFFTLLTLALIAGCGGGGKNSKKQPNSIDITSQYNYQIPNIENDGWQVAHLSDVGIDEQSITNMVRGLFENNTGKTDAIAIIKNGKLVLDVNIRTELDYVDEAEGNTDINKHYMASATKSFASALIGIALHQQPSYTINEPVLNFYTEYSSFKYDHDWKYQSTIKNFLTMRHGFDASDSLIDDLDGNDDFVKAMLDQPMKDLPGSQFQYSSLASIVIGDITEKITNTPTHEFAQSYLFDPLNIEKPRWLKTPKGKTNTGYGLWLSTRDMAKLGQLFLQNGQWQGEQVIPQEWVKLSTEQHVTPEDYAVDGYGFQWWIKDYKIDGEHINTYFAGGNGGQFIVVSPQLELVVLHTGHNYNSYYATRENLRKLMANYILPSILNQ